jgi:peptidoglycan/LPS O-acetylase OafA/YrhL
MKDEHNIENLNFRNNNLNIIRFMAALMVIYGHMFVLSGTQSYTIFHYNEVSTIGVQIFFLISGYLITESYMRDNNLITYWIKRFFRIIPALAFLTFITAFVIGPVLSTYSLKEYFIQNWLGVKMYLRNIFLFPIFGLPGVFNENVYPNIVNGSLWTLPIEVSMYALVPMIITLSKLIKKIDKSIIFLLVVLISVTADVYFASLFQGKMIVVYGTNLFAVLHMIPYFFTGALFTSDKIRKHLNLQVATICIAGYSMLNIQGLPYLYPFISVIVLAYFIFSFAFTKNPIFYKFSEKNDYSYGIYLYGFLVQQTLLKYLFKYEITPNKLALLSMLISLFCAFLSWHIIEKPAQKIGKKMCVWVKQKH